MADVKAALVPMLICVHGRLLSESCMACDSKAMDGGWDGNSWRLVDPANIANGDISAPIVENILTKSDDGRIVKFKRLDDVRPPLFERKEFVSAAGLNLSWKIECDSLTDADWETIAMVGAKMLPPFGSVVGVPRGGLKLAAAMEKYVIYYCGTTLVVDDVFTTGKSLKKVMDEYDGSWGFVAFTRAADGALPGNVRAFARIGAGVL